MRDGDPGALGGRREAPGGVPAWQTGSPLHEEVVAAGAPTFRYDTASYNETMRTFVLLAVLAGAALAQEKAADLFNKPPADVDRALRARIAEFFEDHVKGEFRKAEALVAEDTKEFFYDTNKPPLPELRVGQHQVFRRFSQSRSAGEVRTDRAFSGIHRQNHDLPHSQLLEAGKRRLVLVRGQESS